MEVREAMTPVDLIVGPATTLRVAAERMAKRAVGAAVVIDPDGPGPGILTEREIVTAVGAGIDPELATVDQHVTSRPFFATPEWSLEDAASLMASGGFRHLLVVEGGELVGILSSRDILRNWTAEGSTCHVSYSEASQQG